MDHAARAIMTEYKDIILAFGESDEYRYDYPTTAISSLFIPFLLAFCSENLRPYIIAATPRSSQF